MPLNKDSQSAKATQVDLVPNSLKIQIGEEVKAQKNTSFYPISLAEVERRVARKNGRRANSNKLGQGKLFNGESIDNVKEIVNEFGEKIIKINGDIPIDLEVNSGDRFL